MLQLHGIQVLVSDSMVLITGTIEWMDSWTVGQEMAWDAEGLDWGHTLTEIYELVPLQTQSQIAQNQIAVQTQQTAQMLPI